MGKRNQSSPAQARGEGGFMDGWKTRGTNLVNKSICKCKSTFSISIINLWKEASSPKPNEYKMLMARENVYKVQNKNGTFTSNYFTGKYLALNTNLKLFSHWRLWVCHQVSCLHHLSCSHKLQQWNWSVMDIPISRAKTGWHAWIGFCIKQT